MMRPAIYMPCLHKHTADHCIDAHLIRNTWPSLGSQPLSSHLHTRANPADPIPEKQVYTVWMKSLVFNGHGCTIYGQDGRVAYRVDNYACSRRREVYVMDSGGKTLLKLLKKNFGVFKTWKGYSYCSGPAGLEQEDSKPWFSVQKSHRVMKEGGPYSSSCATVTVLISGKVYKIDGLAHKSEYRISSDPDGEVAAEMKRKQTASGVVLGEDVLGLTVSPTADRLLVVCGLLSRCI